ncbi:cytidine deaminase [Tetragenococcus halophilus]|uniref:cytidine deaminase n=1 Tax=Tetragenococcus halophilus TaxID=51669 RepID=UPI00077C2991|nr:cytidine deaminase [Tetragenococcus halophilus]AOF49763.1 cytidine deaminase [Tetragenococcus halophilus]MCF1601096.1 cytidine deaminase [Tetragenococcus halophilus]MCF1676361.1 cytidine deaminase [Tetragenococcus halophilus]MCO7027434.1 cytidine deaminase [Tetragenococcus halophilus]MCO8285327.1 cytidine deaminase [Tetragenococcus halophilus]
MAKAKEEWIAIAQKALKKAYVPYSHFPVGACLVTKQGNIYQGINIENASYGLSNCAERTAIFKAVSEGERDFEHLVIAGNTLQPIAPCGACRQVMVEFFARDMPLTLVGKHGAKKEMTVEQLLPYSFIGQDL